MITTDEKNDITEKLRQLIGQNTLEAQENSRAELSLSTLSFQSTVRPERQIWIDTDFDGIEIDLEDWTDEQEWDNAVARITVESVEEAVAIVKIWLSGWNLDDYILIWQKPRAEVEKTKSLKTFNSSPNDWTLHNYRPQLPTQGNPNNYTWILPKEIWRKRREEVRDRY